MKKLIFILIFCILIFTESKADKFYYKCVNNILEDTGANKYSEVTGGKFFMFIKVDTNKKKLTVHTSAGYDNEKAFKVGTGNFTISDVLRSKFVTSVNSSKSEDEFEINLSNYIEQTGTGAYLKGSSYLKHNLTEYNYTYESEFCVGPLENGVLLEPKQAAKKYKDWIKGKF